MKNEYQKGISLPVSEMNRKWNGWLHPVEATYLLNANIATINDICYIGKAEVWQKGEKNPYMLHNFLQHFILISGFCSARPETLGVKGGMTPLFLGGWCQWHPWFCTALGNSENAAVTSCYTWKGKALHVVSLSCKPCVQAAAVKP